MKHDPFPGPGYWFVLTNEHTQPKGLCLSAVSRSCSHLTATGPDLCLWPARVRGTSLLHCTVHRVVQYLVSIVWVFMYKVGVCMLNNNFVAHISVYVPTVPAWTWVMLDYLSFISTDVFIRPGVNRMSLIILRFIRCTILAVVALQSVFLRQITKLNYSRPSPKASLPGRGCTVM